MSICRLFLRPLSQSVFSSLVFVFACFAEESVFQASGSEARLWSADGCGLRVAPALSLMTAKMTDGYVYVTLVSSSVTTVILANDLGGAVSLWEIIFCESNL